MADLQKTLRVVLLGHGGIGRHHLRLLRQGPGIEVVAVVDLTQPVIAGVSVYGSLDAFWADVELDRVARPDLAMVATPITTHLALAEKLLGLGLHVFVEKPIAPLLSEAKRLQALAHKGNRVLYVGHSERHNPAFAVFLREFRAGITGDLYRVEVNRTGPFPQQVGDAGATIDLAVHDLESLCHLLDNALPHSVFAHREQRIHPLYEDGINAMMVYAPDILVQLTVNWLSPRKNRFLNVYGKKGMLQCDFFHQGVTFFENLYRRSKPEEYGIGGIEVGPEQVFPIEKWEPLAREHQDFFAQVRAGKAAPEQLESAIRAVELANMLTQSAQENRLLQHSGDKP